KGFVRLVANVRAIEAAMLGRGTGHGDKFGGVAVAADLVFEPARKADGAFVHALPSELRHFFDFRLRGDSLEILAHHLLADGGVTDEGGDVEGGGIFLPGFDPWGDGSGRIAVGALDRGGNALRDLGLSQRVGVETIERMIMNVNKAGRED